MLPVRDTRGAVDPIPPSLPDSVSLTFCIILCVLVYMSLSVLAFCPAVATPLRLYLSISFPNAQWCTADAEVQVLCAENPALLRMHSFKSDSATMEDGMFRLMPGALPSYSCILVFWIYSASLSESRSQLNIK